MVGKAAFTFNTRLETQFAKANSYNGKPQPWALLRVAEIEATQHKTV